MSASTATTLIEAFQQTVARYPSHEFVRYHDGKGYVSVSYREFADRVERLGTSFVRLGLNPGDRIALVSENRLEWSLTDYAALSAGLITVPLYATLPPNQIAYILNDSEARAVVVSTASQAEKIAAIRDECPHLETVVCVEENGLSAVEGALSFSELESHPIEDDPAHTELETRRNAAKPDDTITFIYTSGTTGNPKGVILTHHNFLSNVYGGIEALGVTHEDVFLSFLPLSHVFERMAGHYLPMTVGATIVYSRGLRYLADELRIVKPTVMACVPRFYESLQEKILKNIEEAPPTRQKIFHWAMAQGRAWSECVRAGKKLGPGLRAKHALATKLVLRKLQEAVGGRLRFFISGGAPLAVSTAEFFHAAGILILEGYGLTETSPVISVNRPDNYRFGTVGPTIPGVEVKIADDDEILSRGPHIMKGYFKLPEETKRAIDPDGWFHTGDLGALDEDGFLRITGRKKNLFKLSNGKYIAPEPIENSLKASPYIAESVVIGEAQKVAGAIIVPSFAALEEFAQRENIPIEPRSELIKHPTVRKLYREEIDRLTTNLADFEKIRVFFLTDREFTIESGELTATLKVKRREVLSTYEKEIEALFSGGE